MISPIAVRASPEAGWGGSQQPRTKPIDKDRLPLTFVPNLADAILNSAEDTSVTRSAQAGAVGRLHQRALGSRGYTLTHPG